MSKIKCSLFAMYLTVLLKLTVFRDTTMAERQVNLKLFSNYINVLREGGIFRFVWLFFGNLGWFVPWGFFVPIIKKSNFLTTVFSGFVFSLIIEALQFALKKGFFEIDDLILNTLGTALGYGLYKLWELWVKK